MTGHITIKCKGCGTKIWITWGYGGPREFMKYIEEKSYCDVCRPTELSGAMVDSLQTSETPESEEDEEDGQSPDEAEIQARLEEMPDAWDGVPGC